MPIDARTHEQVRAQLAAAELEKIRLATELNRALAKCEQLERERGTAARQAAARMALLERIIDNAPVGVIYYDPDLTIRRANPLIARLLGLPVAQLRDRQLTELFPELDVNWHFGPVLERGETVRRSGFEHRYRVDGQEHLRYWNFVNVPIFDEGGTLAGVLGMAVEVSDQVALEKLQGEQIELLEQTTQLKDQFLGILSHELRTPINAIMGFASVLDDELAGELNAEQKKYTERILAGSDVLLALVDDLLDMSRIQAGRFGIEPVPMAFGEVVEDVLLHLEPLFQQYGGQLTSQVPAGLPPVLAEPRRVRQVLVSLLGNAARHGAGSITTLTACLREGCLRCEIRDHGRGVSAEDQTRLFRAFGQLDTSSTREHGGLGLGLALVRAIVEALGGRCGVESVVGEGSTFWFTLPLAQ